MKNVKYASTKQVGIVFKVACNALELLCFTKHTLFLKLICSNSVIANCVGKKGLK